MSRLRRIEQQDRLFFVTTNLARDVAPLTETERTLLLKILERARARPRFKIFVYVVMPDHVHLLLEPLANTLTSVMREFKSKSALELNKLRATNGPFWQPRFFDFICRRVRDFSEKAEYIHRNPVAAGFVSRPEDWKWSSAGYWLDRRDSEFVPDFIDLPAEGSTLLWPAPWRRA